VSKPTGIVADAFALRRACREEFEDWRIAQYQRAAEDCRGSLINRLGRERGIDARSLFLGSADRANLYASDELLEWWRTHPRMNYRMWEEQWVRNRMEVPI
jgi:hypothetical protein